MHDDNKEIKGLKFQVLQLAPSSLGKQSYGDMEIS